MTEARATAPSKGSTGGLTPTTSVPYRIMATGSTSESVAHKSDGFFPCVSICVPCGKGCSIPAPFRGIPLSRGEARFAVYAETSSFVGLPAFMSSRLSMPQSTMLMMDSSV